MKVVEKFVSINGESKRAGELAVFIRFKGCNLNCSYCDTKWANEANCPYKEETVDDIVDYIKQSGVKNVTLTGGEPLLQSELSKLIAKILEIQETRVEIETNGSMDIRKIFEDCNICDNDRERVCVTMDYKSPSSGCETQMLIENFEYLTEYDVVKFVVGSQDDLDKAKEIIEKNQLDVRCQVFVSPIFGEISLEEIVNYMIENQLNDIKLQIQMHKVIWDPDKRGV